MYAPIYYSYLTLIDLCMYTYFLNKIIWLVALLFGTNFKSYNDLFFWTDGVVANGSNSSGQWTKFTNIILANLQLANSNSIVLARSFLSWRVRDFGCTYHLR